MNIIKTASTKLTKKMLSGPYGNFNAYVVIGDTPSDTYNIKDSLARLGFKWFGAQKVWYLAENKMTPFIQQQLQNIRVITENQPIQTTQTSQQTQTSVQTPQTPETPQIPQTPQKPTTKQYVTEDEEMTKWYKFPINKNIDSYELEFEVDGEKHKEKITVDRLYVPGKDSNEYQIKKSREHIGLPYYVFNIGEKTQKKKYSEETEQVPDAQLKFISKEKYGTYNEEEHIEKLKTIVKQIIEDNPPTGKSSTARNLLRWKYDLAKRTPELTELINSIYNKTYESNFKCIITDAENPEYNGEYPVNFTIYNYTYEPAKDLYIQTNLNIPGAPSSKTIAYPKLFKIHTVEDFNNLVNKNLKQDETIQAYIDYLSSFPFLQSQKESNLNSFQEIQSMLSNPASIPSQTIMKKLQALGYIRPSKRQKQFEGISSGEEIKWIVDSKKIVNDIYSNQFLQNSTDFFYAIVAYYIHRQIKNIWSWSDAMLMDSIGTWIRNMKKLGAELNYREIVKSIEYVGQYIIKELFPRQEQEKQQETYNPLSSTVPSLALEKFKNIAREYNIDTDNIEDNLKSVYRVLAKEIHPDKYSDPIKKEEMTEKFKEMQNIWDELKQIYKISMNWYDIAIIKYSK